MPSKVFDQLNILSQYYDVPNNNFTYQNPGTINVALPTLVTHLGPGWYEFFINIPVSATGIANTQASIQGAGPITADFTLDYSDPLDIPDDALITKITLRYPRSINLLFGTIKAGGNFWCNVTGFTTYNSGTPIVGLSKQVIESFAGSDADEIMFDYNGVPADRLTKAELIASYSYFNPNGPPSLILQVIDPAVSLQQSSAAMIGTITQGDGWTVTVEYEQDFHFDFTVSQDTAPVEEDSVVTVTSDPDSLDPPPLDMEMIETIDIEFEDPDNPGSFITIPVLVFTAVSPNLLTFVIPDFGVYQPPHFVILITSTQFSGTASLQSLWTIWFTSASGLYQLNLDKTNDTLYLEDSLPNTIDVKFYPNPKLKTGFIRG